MRRIGSSGASPTRPNRLLLSSTPIRRVQIYATGLAGELGVRDDATIKAIEAAALLHDTGKLAVPEHILNKPGKLTAEEFEQMKKEWDEELARFAKEDEEIATEFPELKGDKGEEEQPPDATR